MYFGIFHGGTEFGCTKKFLADAVTANPSKPILNTEFGYWSSENGGTASQQITAFDSTYAALSLYAPIDQSGAARTSGPLMGITWWAAFDWYTHQQTSGYQSMGLMKMDRISSKPVLTFLSMAYKKLVDKSEYITGVGSDVSPFLPAQYDLEQNYPNPFNPSTIIRYKVPETSTVTLTIFDALGRGVETLVNGQKTAGTYTIEWNSGNKSSGVYFYRLHSGSFDVTKKMAVVR
jgi:hypothetical protein